MRPPKALVLASSPSAISSFASPLPHVVTVIQDKAIQKHHAANHQKRNTDRFGEAPAYIANKTAQTWQCQKSAQENQAYCFHGGHDNGKSWQARWPGRRAATTGGGA